MQFEEAGKFIIKRLSDELPDHLTYHNVKHTVNVYRAAEYIGTQEGISDYEMKILLTAACFHDSGFLIRAIGHEVESCHIAKEALSLYQYSPDEIERICGIIMVTKLPQTPHNQLEMILADADLDYLGRDDFFTIAHKLFLENAFLGFIADENAWNQTQIWFIQNHQYFTKTAVNLRQAKKETNLELIKAKINTRIK
jgi:uncharacterized protein